MTIAELYSSAPLCQGMPMRNGIHAVLSACLGNLCWASINWVEEMPFM